MADVDRTCAGMALDIKTYYAGKNQLTHPNVVAFAESWHGYRYYMAYTTYPYANGSEENPCLAASNDLINWEKPEGLINPIACCEETECDELKDSHLLYREDLDRLELWYLGRISSTIERGGYYIAFARYLRMAFIGARAKLCTALRRWVLHLLASSLKKDVIAFTV